MNAWTGAGPGAPAQGAGRAEGPLERQEGAEALERQEGAATLARQEGGEVRVSAERVEHPVGLDPDADALGVEGERRLDVGERVLRPIPGRVESGEVIGREDLLAVDLLR